MGKKLVLVAVPLALLLSMAALRLCRRPAAAPAARNLLLITLDTTRADRLGCYGDRQARTPAMDALARAGVVFERCYTPVPLTLPAHGSLLTGRWPVAHDVRTNTSGKLSAAQWTLAEGFRAAGFDTAALIAAYVLKSKFGIAQGFDQYDDDLGYEEKAGNIDAQIPADRVYAKFRKWLPGKRGKPFFLWVHFYDPHKPYAPPAAYLERAGGDAYRGEVAYMDHYIGRIVADLKERDLFASTLIVVAGDHGEGFGEHGESGHGVFCYDETLRVPLVFSGGGLAAKPRRIQEPASLVDVMPTILKLFAIDAKVRLQGLNLEPCLAGSSAGDPSRPLILESMYGRELNNWAPLTGLIRGDFKYISLPRAELYDLRADPGEKENLFFKQNPRARQMDRELAAFFARHESGSERNPQMDLKAEDKANLATLGYISSFAAAGQAGMDPKTGIAYQSRFSNLVAALDHEDIRVVEAEALRLRDETLALKMPFAYVMLQYVYERKKQWDKVESNLNRALAIFQDNPAQALTFRINLLEFYLAGGRLVPAEKLAREMLAIYPDNVRVVEILGEIAEKRQDWFAALKWYRRAGHIEIRSIALAKKVIRMLMKTGNDPAARQESEALLKTTQGASDADLHFAAAMLAVAAGDGARAEELVRRLTELQPTGPRWFDYALVLGSNGKLDAAIAAMEKALAATPGELDGERLQSADKALALWRSRRGN